MFGAVAAISYDGNGRFLHRGDEVALPNSEGKFEVYDVLGGNRVSIINSEGVVEVVDSGNTQRVEKEIPQVPHFETPPIEKENEPKEMGETRLMSPIEEPINLAADALMAAMKKVKASVMPLQYNLKRLVGSSLEKTGDWKEGNVEAEIFVSDLLMKRKAVITVNIIIKEGKAYEPFSFTTSTGRIYPFTEAGFRKSLNIPLTPYISKRPGAATLSSRRD